MRKVPFVDGEYYHIYNRGVDKRAVFSDQYDVARFFQSMEEFNTVEPITSIYHNSFRRRRPTSQSERLVEFVAYCLNPNHYHFILKQSVEGGISEFMKRLGGGYTKYFNERKERSGALFQGRFKSVHVDTNDYLLRLSAYVNLNNRVHQIGGGESKLVRSSWREYMGEAPKNSCEKDIVLGQFRNISEYRDFAEDVLRMIVAHRYPDATSVNKLLIEDF